MINYTMGDATLPLGSGNKIIVHICNDTGGWGKGFVLAISKRWKAPEQQYREWFQSKENFKLGAVQVVQVNDDTWVANMIGQHKIYKDENDKPPIRYAAVEEGLQQVAKFAVDNKASVHMPRIGCGLAGGNWGKIEPLITTTLINQQVPVTVYDF